MSQAMLMYRSGGALQGERLLQICIGGSIVLHVLAMLYAPKVEPPVVPPTKFTATLRAAPAPKPAAPEAAPAPPEPVAPKVETPPPPPVVTPAPPAPPVPAAKPIPEKAPSKSVAAAPAAAPTPATPAPAAPPLEARSAAPANEAKDASKSPAAPPAAAGDVDEKAVIARYASQLAQVAGKYKRYPNDAMQNQWEGTALVTLRIGVDGRIMGAPEITISSGHEILDAEARTTINKAKPFVQIPAELKGKEFVVQVRVVFSLKT